MQYMLGFHMYSLIHYKIIHFTILKGEFMAQNIYQFYIMFK